MVTIRAYTPPEHLEETMLKAGAGKPTADDIKRCQEDWERQTPEHQETLRKTWEKKYRKNGADASKRLGNISGMSI
jgi:hypothetical protein